MRIPPPLYFKNIPSYESKRDNNKPILKSDSAVFSKPGLILKIDGPVSGLCAIPVVAMSLAGDLLAVALGASALILAGTGTLVYLGGYSGVTGFKKLGRFLKRKLKPLKKE